VFCTADNNIGFAVTSSILVVVDDLIVKWTYNSNAIEGNTLTLQETKVVLSGITIGGKTMIEHLEAINHMHFFLILWVTVNKICHFLCYLKKFYWFVFCTADNNIGFAVTSSILVVDI
jgi:hypothetical protein